MPSAELFFDFCWTFPDAKFILTTRPALEWAKSRKLHLPYSSLAPIEEPCGYYIDDFADEVSAKLFEHHNNLVRCMVPKERLFEINVWTDSEENGKTPATIWHHLWVKGQLDHFQAPIYDCDSFQNVI